MLTEQQVKPRRMVGAIYDQYCDLELLLLNVGCLGLTVTRLKINT